MNVLVCVKRVPAPGARINVSADGQSVDTAFLGFTTSPHEECAVEAAVQLAEAHGGSTTVLTVGPLEAEEQLRYAASVGIGAAVLVATDGADADPQRTARSIVAAIGELEAAAEPFDLVLFGNESADACGFQVGARVAVALDRPFVNGAKGLALDDDMVRVERPTDAGTEVYRLPRPAVVGVKEGINLPRYPTLKGRLASKKVAVTTLGASGEQGGLVMARLKPPTESASAATVVLGSGPDAAPAVVDLLAELGVLS